MVNGVTGEFFDEQSWEELADHLIRFNDGYYQPEVIREHAQKFGVERFKQEMKHLVERVASGH